MFCPKCGNILNEGAAFCPKCGNKVGGGSASAPPNLNLRTEPEKKGARKKGLIIGIAAAVVILLIIGVSSSNRSSASSYSSASDTGSYTSTEEPSEAESTSESSEEAWLENNRGRGALTEYDLAAALMKAIDEWRVSSLIIYWDAQQEERGVSFDDYADQTYRDWYSAQPLKLDEARYKVVDSNPIGVTLEIYVDDYAGNSLTYSVMVHENDTPEGSRWFLGPSGYYN